MKRKPVYKWAIFKRHFGERWPGDWWDDFPSEKAARKAMVKDYHIERRQNTFSIVRVTCEDFTEDKT